MEALTMQGTLTCFAGCRGASLINLTIQMLQLSRFVRLWQLSGTNICIKLSVKPFRSSQRGAVSQFERVLRIVRKDRQVGGSPQPA